MDLVTPIAFLASEINHACKKQTCVKMLDTPKCSNPVEPAAAGFFNEAHLQASPEFVRAAHEVIGPTDHLLPEHG